VNPSLPPLICPGDEKFKRFEQPCQLEFGGFDPIVLLRDHRLVNGNSHLGVLMFRDRPVVFSSSETCLEFAKEPEQIEKKILKLARPCYPSLVGLMNLSLELDDDIVIVCRAIIIH
jgi:hypothetical protein